jgi:hypothetical protein
LIEIPEEIRKKWHYLLKDVETVGLRKKWLWNWYFVIVLEPPTTVFGKVVKRGRTDLQMGGSYWKDW